MEKGIVIVNTGGGKGKTTAALGIILRCIGRGYKTALIQFIKDEKSESGERDILRKLGCDVYICGRGFTWENTKEENAEAFLNGFNYAKKCLTGGEYDLVVLDEINCALSENCFDAASEDDIKKLIAERSPETTVVLTGRGAPQQIIDTADTVTEMKEIKHAFNSGIGPIKGIEY